MAAAAGRRRWAAGHTPTRPSAPDHGGSLSATRRLPAPKGVFVTRRNADNPAERAAVALERSDGDRITARVVAGAGSSLRAGETVELLGRTHLMKMRLMCLLCASLIAGCALAGEPVTERTISVSGKGLAQALPDRAVIHAGVERIAADVQTARTDADRAVSALLAALQDLGVPSERVTASGAHIQPEYQWLDKTRERRISGYRVSRELRIELQPIDRLGAVLGAAVEAGMNRLSPPELGLVDEAALRDQALAAAAADARRQAEVLSRALGAELGAVQRVELLDEGGPWPMQRAKAMTEMRAADHDMPVQVGEIRLAVQVRVAFALR